MLLTAAILSPLVESSIRVNYGFSFSGVPDERWDVRADDAAMKELERAGVVNVMHRGVVSCHGESPALTAARTMAAHRIHCVVVEGEDGMPRMVTDLDVAAAMYDEQLEELTCRELSRPAALLRPEDTVAFALERLHELGTGHAVVVGPSLELLGVVSVLDLVEWTLRRRSVERRNSISDRPDAQALHGIDT